MTKIGKYDLLEGIGRGAMGVVWKARDPVLGRLVALKMIEDPDPEVRTRFVQEARSAGKLSHGNIVTIYELGEDRGRFYIAMEFLEGEDLKTKLASGSPMTLEEKLYIMTDVASGLAHAHEMQVIHRDIKPANIFVTNRGEVKVLDFGLAHVASNRITKTGAVLGTPSYMSPEQVRGLKVDRRSDVFSLGAVCYELACGRKAFPGATVAQTFYQILHEQPAPFEELVPGTSAGLGAVVSRAMEKNPAARQASVDVLLHDLRRCRESIDEKKREIRSEVREHGAAVAKLRREQEDALETDPELESIFSRLEAALTLEPGESLHPLDELRGRWERIQADEALLSERLEREPQSPRKASTRLKGIFSAFGKSP